MDVEGVGEAHEETEERTVVNRFSNLCVGPPGIAQALDLFVRDPVRMTGQRLDEFQQEPVPGTEPGGIEVAVS
jgi:hypothetical protein